MWPKKERTEKIPKMAKGYFLQIPSCKSQESKRERSQFPASKGQGGVDSNSGRRPRNSHSEGRGRK
jgi:hypothetical protein